MKAANKQIEIRLPKIQELTLLGNPAPHRAPEWRQWAHRLAALVAWLARAPRLTRAVGPGLPEDEEYRWRAADAPRGPWVG